MNINHHLDDATLLSYSAGAMSQGMALVTASHIACCDHCRSRVAMTNAVGGALLEATQTADVGSQMLNNILNMLEEPQGNELKPAEIGNMDSEVPLPLQEYIGQNLDELEWKRIVPGVSYFDLPWKGRGVSRLLRIAPGKSMLPHTHDGNELTLVIRGSFSDEMGRFAPGDVADLDDAIEHQPLVDSREDCICLIATDAPLKFTTLFGKLVQPITGF